MATLIAVYTSEGCVGRCDAKCYNATVEKCDCICGGRNHGAGIQKAVDNTREMWESWVEHWKKEHPDLAPDAEFVVREFQTVTQQSFIPGMAFTCTVPVRSAS